MGRVWSGGRALGLATTILALVGTGAPLAAQDAGAPTLPSIELPADVARVLRDYERAWADGDAAALAELFTTDGFVLSGGDPHVRGRDAIRARYANAGGPLRLRAVHFELSDDVGFIVGAFAYEDGGPDLGKFLLALRRVEGRWLIVADMDNPIRGDGASG